MTKPVYNPADMSSRRIAIYGLVFAVVGVGLLVLGLTSSDDTARAAGTVSGLLALALAVASAMAVRKLRGSRPDA